MRTEFTDDDLEQIARQGILRTTIKLQFANFECGVQNLATEQMATIKIDGVLGLNSYTEKYLITVCLSYLAQNHLFTRFTPILKSAMSIVRDFCLSINCFTTKK